MSEFLRICVFVHCKLNGISKWDHVRPWYAISIVTPVSFLFSISCILYTSAASWAKNRMIIWFGCKVCSWRIKKVYIRLPETTSQHQRYLNVKHGKCVGCGTVIVNLCQQSWLPLNGWLKWEQMLQTETFNCQPNHWEVTISESLKAKRRLVMCKRSDCQSDQILKAIKELFACGQICRQMCRTYAGELQTWLCLLYSVGKHRWLLKWKRVLTKTIVKLS